MEDHGLTLFQSAGVGIKAMFLLSAAGGVLGVLAVLIKPEKYLRYRRAPCQEQS